MNFLKIASRILSFLRNGLSFNFLIGNTDAHAKNLSLLHSDSGVKLAPFYDLLSTEVYPESIIDHEMAMLINGKGKYSSLRPKDFIALFENLEQNATNMMKTIKDKFADIVPAAEKLRENMPDPDIPIYNKIIAIIKKRFLFYLGRFHLPSLKWHRDHVFVC